MSKILTEGSEVTCAHQGKVKLTASQKTLKVDGQWVLVEGDLIGATISGCKTVTSQTSAPCNTVLSMSMGAAVKLKVNQKAVLLDTALGTTDGLPAPAALWNVKSAGQSKMDAL